MTRTARLSSNSVIWAANHLVDCHGDDAPGLAQARTAEMELEGRSDLAAIWQMVERTVAALLDCREEREPLFH
ncbi:MAG: hypothetical protein TEF_21640 [Rhizobiales bacterium NRL2]|nr:MAG: hypothetical protein TEF_21640 [Rhizobiales bacterium NRL2]